MVVLFHPIALASSSDAAHLSVCAVMCIIHDTNPNITATHLAHAAGLHSFTPALSVMVYILSCYAGVVVDEVEVLPSDPPQRPTSVPQALQQNMPLASVSRPYPLTCQCFACCFAAALCFCLTTDATQHADFCPAGL